ncbi:Holo-[acyl-carrier protein] synthase [hydrothermal vent metagenome]|uniref:Holo-[acyl-carrier protein] synthase n=1 Tax=hydrothermal vent metagenome TaxID=652676 RepID=A0A3B1DXK5_9ZZZZ
MVGIDIVTISRIEKMIQRFGDKALHKFLSKKEIKLSKKISTIAGFWAAKEAASKAIGTGIGQHCSFKDIKITKNKKGQPFLRYKKRLRLKFKINNSSLSISHDGNFAIAVVINT